MQYTLRTLLKMTLPIICILCIVTQAEARPSSFGIGFVIGQPQGLAVQVPVTRFTALNASIFYDLRVPRIHAHLDQIQLNPKPIFSLLYPYIGYGALVSVHQSKNTHGDAFLSARLPLGFEVGNKNIRGLIELAPALGVLPLIQFDIQVALGCRLHF